MKRTSTRLLAFLMCVLMFAAMLPLTALAAAPESVRKAVSTSVVSNGKPKITRQPKSVSVKQGAKITLKVVAKGGGLKYQWYYRTGPSAAWKKVSNGKKASLKITVGRYNGWQYRCKVSNKSGSVTSKAAKLKVDQVEYRALLIAEVSFGTDTESDGFAARMAGDLLLMDEALANVKGPMGGKYTTTYGVDLTNDGIRSAIKSAFANANDNDVSLFFISTHGVSSLPASDVRAGALATYKDGSSNNLLYLSTLAGWLSQVPGKVIVMIGSCGSGAAVYQNGVLQNNAASATDDAAFTQAVIRAFAAKDSRLPDDGTAANTGEFCTNKFYVLTAAAHGENSIGWERSDNDVSDSYNLFAAAIHDGMLKYGGYADADWNYDGTITLNELYKYICYVVQALGKTQHTQVYPANSSYALFK